MATATALRTVIPARSLLLPSGLGRPPGQIEVGRTSRVDLAGLHAPHRGTALGGGLGPQERPRASRQYHC